MRRTGKLYALTLISSFMAILASVLASCWNENTSALHLWVDLIPQGLGVASFITTTLIVCFSLLLTSSYMLANFNQAMIAGVYKEDMPVAIGSTSFLIVLIRSPITTFFSYLPFPNYRTSSWCEPKRCAPTSCSFAEATTANTWTRCSRSQ